MYPFCPCNINYPLLHEEFLSITCSSVCFLFLLQPYVDEFHPSTTPSDADCGMTKSQNNLEGSTSKISSNFEAHDPEVENL
jgi:hypothetical protein